jgi:site-specific recombinase XerC
MWTSLHEGLPGGDDFKTRRNRLVLLLMMRAALTVREIVVLTLDCAQPCADLPGAPASLYLLRVRKEEGGHERTLQLDLETSQALHAWLEVRPIGLPALHPGSRLVVGDRIGRAIAPNGLYNICQAHLARCLREKGLLAEQAPHTVLDPGALAHMGPNTLRNTCIAEWFNAGVPLQEIQRRCGFKDASVMSRLGAHLVNPFSL